MSTKAIVLSSGGVDSTTCLGLAIDDVGAENVLTVSVLYGQKHKKELECAKKLAEYYNVKHETLDLSEIFKYSNCSLLSQSTEEVPEGDYADQINRDANGKVSTYVPFRNGLMLSSVASMAQSIFPDDEVKLYIGAHADDAAGNAYADCSVEFTDAIGEAIRIGTYNKVPLVAPLVHMNKAEVVRTGLELKVPYELTWSCYNGQDKSICSKWCRRSCIKVKERTHEKDRKESNFTLHDFRSIACNF